MKGFLLPNCIQSRYRNHTYEMETHKGGEKMKKKAILCITTAAAVLIFGTTTALAAYTDGNGDGLCDNAAATCPQPQDGTGRQAGLGNAGLGQDTARMQRQENGNK